MIHAKENQVGIDTAPAGCATPGTREARKDTVCVLNEPGILDTQISMTGHSQPLNHSGCRQAGRRAHTGRAGARGAEVPAQPGAQAGFYGDMEWAEAAGAEVLAQPGAQVPRPSLRLLFCNNAAAMKSRGSGHTGLWKATGAMYTQGLSRHPQWGHRDVKAEKQLC